MKKILDIFNLQTILKVLFGFMLASVYYNTKASKPVKTNDGSLSIDSLNLTTTILPEIEEKSFSELEQVKYAAHEKFGERRKRIKGI